VLAGDDEDNEDTASHDGVEVAAEEGERTDERVSPEPVDAFAHVFEQVL